MPQQRRTDQDTVTAAQVGYSDIELFRGGAYDSVDKQIAGTPSHVGSQCVGFADSTWRKRPRL
jgi:hypothetical protein